LPIRNIFLVIASGFFLVIRTKNLLSVPVYLDEAIYVNWGYMFKTNRNLAYLPMQNGKTPLYFWIISFFYDYFNQPLIAARFISEVAGLGTMLLGWWLTKKLFDQKTAFIFLPLYALIPYAQFIERMAFADSLQVFWGMAAITLAVYSLDLKFSIKNIFRQIFIGSLTGIILGLGFMTKSSAKIYLFSIFLILFLQILKNFKNIKKSSLVLLFGIFSWLTYSEVLTAFKTASSRFFLNIAEKEKLLTYSPREVLQNPFNLAYLKHLPLVSGYFFHYITIPVLILTAFSLFKIAQKRNFNGLIFFLTGTFVFSGIFFVSKTPASRYFFPVVPFIIILASYGLKEITKSIKNKRLNIIAIISIFTPLLWFSYRISGNAQYAFWHPEDRHYLYESSLSGIGVQEVIQYLKNQLQTSEVVLAVDSFWGQPDYINLMLQKEKHQFLLKKYGNLHDSYNDLEGDLANSKVFLLSLRENSSSLENQNLKLIKSFSRATQKNGKTDQVYFYEMLP